MVISSKSLIFEDFVFVYYYRCFPLSSNVSTTHGCEGKKNSSFATRFFIGIANVLFCAWGVVVPNAPIRRKVRGGKKLKPLAVRFALVEFIFVIFIVVVKVALKCHKSVFWLGAN
jgi:hypothetical protein